MESFLLWKCWADVEMNKAGSLSSRRLSYSVGERQQMTNYDVGWKEISRGIHSTLWK